MKVCASPNIAFIKYWGKLPHDANNPNLATNPSISMTLKNAQTTVETTLLPSSALQNEIFINSKPASLKDIQKIETLIERISKHFSISSPPKIKIDSVNNFPQGTGMASSASAFAALTISISGAFLGKNEAEIILQKQPKIFSTLARMGSGSACRSIFPGFTIWDWAHAEPIQSDWKLKDTILIFSREEKKISSTDGHASAKTSSFFESRLKNLPSRIEKTLHHIENKNLTGLGLLLEEEALEMHSIALTSHPSIFYMNSFTWKLISHLSSLSQRNFYFTLDAGPNVHIISQDDIQKDIQKICNELNIPHDIWLDEWGSGPKII